MKSFWGPRLAAAIAAVCLVAFPGVVMAQYTTVSASHLGGTQTPMTGTIYWQTIVPARIGSSGGQMVSGMPAQAVVTAGAFSLSLPDALQASPNICYAVTGIDGTTGAVLFGAGLAASGQVKTGGAYGCVQPTGSTWSFDSYDPPATPPAIYEPVPGPQGPAGAGYIDGLSSDGASGIAVAGAVKAAGPVSSGPTPSQSSSTIVAVGDSLTYGQEGYTNQGNWPSDLATLSGYTVANIGVKGQASAQISVRQGGIPTYATVSGNQIPASGGVTVTFPTGFEPVTSNGPAGGTPGTIAGVHGIVTLSGSTYTFTRDASGSAVKLNGAVQFFVDTPYQNAMHIIWAGHNDGAGSSLTLPNIESMVSFMAPWQNYLVLSDTIDNLGSAYWSGGASYSAVWGLNYARSIIYSGHYLDILTPLVNYGQNSSHITDQSDYAHGVPATSLRAVLANGTLTANIGSTDTSVTLTVTGGSLASPDVLVCDTGANEEEMGVTAVSGSTLTVSRGWGGNQTSHSSGAACTLYDAVHFNATGYQQIANAIWTWLQSNPPVTSGVRAGFTSDAAGRFESSAGIVGSERNRGGFGTAQAPIPNLFALQGAIGQMIFNSNGITPINAYTQNLGSSTAPFLGLTVSAIALQSNSVPALNWKVNGTTYWQDSITGANGNRRITDSLNGLVRMELSPNGQTILNAGTGSNAVVFGSTVNSGSGGIQLWGGTSSPTEIGYWNGSGLSAGTHFYAPDIAINSTTANAPLLNFQWNGVTNWELSDVASGSDFRLLDVVNGSLVRAAFTPNGVSILNAGNGANDLEFNRGNNSGTNGISLWSGSSSSAKVGAWTPSVFYPGVPIEATGTSTVSGCSLTGAVGGSFAGSFASGTAGTCTVTITPGITANHGFWCKASDITTPADSLPQTGSSLTTCTISGTTASGDSINWLAIAY